MESCRVALEWRSRCQCTLPNPSALAAGLSCRASNVRRTVVGPAVTRESALQRERTRIEEYCRTPDGKKARYNKV